MRNLVVLLALTVTVTVTDAARGEGLGDPYEAYLAGEYDKALQGFTDLQIEHPEDPGLALHLGSAHFQMKNYTEAEKSFGQAALGGDPQVRERAMYNLGNTAYRQGKLQDAVEWYKRALEAEPDDEDAKYNLEFVRDEIRRRIDEAKKRQEQQQQQPQQQEQQQEQEKKQDQGDQQEKQEGQQEQNQDGQEQQEQEQEQQQQDGQQEQEQEKQEGQQAQQQEQQQEEQGGQPQQAERARQMTPEEAERYLQGLSEDRKKHLEKRRGKRGQRSRPAKDW